VYVQGRLPGWDRDWRLALESRLFTRVTPAQPQWGVRRDDYIQLELPRNF
jgi:hypothetical protein